MPISPSGLLTRARTLIGFEGPGGFQAVAPLTPLPIGGADSAETTLTINSLAATTAIDTGSYRWAVIQMTAGYSGMTSLTPQASQDNTAWFSTAVYGVGNTSSGITTNLGTSAALFAMPIPFKYLRFNPAGTYGSGSCVLKVTLLTEPQFMASFGANANIAAIGGSVAPAISSTTLSLGTAASNGFQARVTNTTTVSATTLLAGVSGQMPYITDICWTYVGTGNPILTLQAAANALIPVEICMEPNKSDNRTYRHPHKVMSSTNNILQYVVTGTFTGTWYFTVHGYYTTS